MAAARFQPELRKPAGSPRPKGRENAKDTLCRNVLIYGHCRYEDQGCAFNHDPHKPVPSQMDVKKTLNVDSPAFTPATLSVPTKPSSIISAVNAAPFTPRGIVSGTATPNSQIDAEPVALNPAQIKEFTPQNYDLNQTLSTNGAHAEAPVQFDVFQAALNQTIPSTPYNPYDESNIASNAGGYYQAQPAYASVAQPLQYHLYAPITSHKEDLQPYQKLVHDLFIPNDLLEDFQRRAEAARQVLPNSQLPIVDQYHSLVALDTSHHKSTGVFGYPTWVYKAVSGKNGVTYVLRRIEGFRLSNERAIQSVRDWKKVDNGGIVKVNDAFTTRAFGDSSLMIVYDYHPRSETIMGKYGNQVARYGNRHPVAALPPTEQVLWSFIVQIASAIKAVHEVNLAVRCMEPSKVLITGENRVRLNACSVMDITRFEIEGTRPMADLQQEDFILFGRLILAIASRDMTIASAAHVARLTAALEGLKRRYSLELCDAIHWLLNTPTAAAAEPAPQKDINEFLRGISPQVVASYDSSIHANDTLTAVLSRELENGRLFRLMAKLGTINERPEFEGDTKWSEVGDRYILKLFRDYVFHQVDADGRPVTNLGHILQCLNNLDTSSPQMIKLTSRDNSDCFFVSYKDLKKQVDSAFQELTKNPVAGKRY